MKKVIITCLALILTNLQNNNYSYYVVKIVNEEMKI